VIKLKIKVDEKINQKQIKVLNRANILKAFREHEVVQKNDLVQMLGLSITTVTSNIKSLLEEGFIESVGIAKSTGGRKPVVLQFVKNARVTIGVDISPHRVSMILTNLSSEIIDSDDFKVANGDMTAILASVEEHINRLLKKHSIDKEQCIGVGLSLPGVVDEEKNILINAPNLKVENYTFEAFEASLGLPLYLENEANVAAFAELILGEAKHSDDVIYISITDGVGCGIITNHCVSKGSFKKAGEFGHMRISDKDIKCSCGRKGCWELFASERALLKHYQELSGIILPDLRTFFDKYSEGSSDVNEALRVYFDYLTIGIENIVLGLDPEKIIIGGEIAKYLLEIEPFINEYMKRNHSILESNDNKIVLSKLAPRSAVLGGSLLPLKDMFDF